MNPGLAAFKLFRPSCDFLSVLACKSAWNGHFWAFSHPCGSDVRTDTKSARSAHLTGTCTPARLRSRDWRGKMVMATAGERSRDPVLPPDMLRMRTLPPGFIPPCLPTKASTPPSGGLWLHEIKHDGFRIIARWDGKRVRLYSRSGNGLVGRFPLIVEGLVFLRSRAGPGLRLNEHLEHDDGEMVFRHACKLGLEGIVSKRKGSPYRSGRSPDWLKMKNPDAPAVKREAEEDWGKTLHK
jgi:hypothetical protein